MPTRWISDESFGKAKSCEMMTFKQYVAERRTSGGTLFVFDVDETLFRTTAKILVVKNGQVVHELDNQRFNDYELKDGESFDYSEFRDAEKFHTESKPILNMIKTLIRVNDKIKLNLTPGSKVIINTARSSFDDTDLFHDKLKQHGIDLEPSAVRTAGDINLKVPAERKQAVVRQYLNRRKYDSAYMYDDSKTNLTYFLQLKHEYPDVDFRAFLIDEDGEMHDFNPDTR